MSSCSVFTQGDHARLGSTLLGMYPMVRMKWLGSEHTGKGAGGAARESEVLAPTCAKVCCSAMGGAMGIGGGTWGFV